MGLAAGEFDGAGRLKGLSAAPKPTARADVYLAVASLFRGQGARLSDRERSLMSDILFRLAPRVDPSVRASLAESLADDPQAPHELVFALATDSIDISRPVILRGSALTDDDLLRLIAGGSEAHRIACAGRPHIGESVVKALFKTGSRAVLAALAKNATLRSSFRTEGVPAQSDRRSTEGRPTDPKGSLAMGGPTNPHVTMANVTMPNVAMPNVAMLVEKLAADGQLRAGFLLRALQQQQFELFDLAFAKLLELELTRFRHVFYAQGPRAAALACRAVGIDRSVFGTVFDLSRAGQRTRAWLTPDERVDVEDAFARYSRLEAKARLLGGAPI